MAKVDYGAVALIPVGEYSASRQYHANELVGYQGSSYVALQNPPVGTLPTNTTYFMLHTEGTSIATASTPGTVKPDGTSTVVDASGAMSVKPSIVQTIQDTAELAAEEALKIGNVPTGKSLQSQIDDLEPRVSSSEQALTVNLLNPTLQRGTLTGITFVRNADNSYTLNGTATKDTYLIVAREFTTTKSQKVRITGCPQGGTESTFYAAVQMSNGTSTVRDLGYGATRQLSAGESYNFLIVVKSGAVCDNLLFKPMLTTNLSATYDDYVPYSGSSGNLNTDYANLLVQIHESNHDTTANMLNPTLPSGTGSGLTYVKNNDNSYTISGTNTSENAKNLILAPIASIGFESGKTYRVLGCPSDTPAGVYMMVGSQIRENGEGANFSYPVSSGQSVYISIAAGASIETPITIKPMITTNLYATYDDYVPYTGDSGRLNEDVVKIRTDVAQNKTDIATNAADISALNTGLTNSIVHGVNPNSSVYSGLIARKDNEIMHMKVTTGLNPEVYSSSDGGQTFTGGAFLPIKSHTAYELQNPPQTTLNSFSTMDWDTGIVIPTLYGHSLWEIYNMAIPYAGGDTIVPTNTFLNTENSHLIVRCYNASNRTATNISLLIVILDEYWVKGINY